MLIISCSFLQIIINTRALKFKRLMKTWLSLCLCLKFIDRWNTVSSLKYSTHDSSYNDGSRNLTAWSRTRLSYSTRFWLKQRTVQSKTNGQHCISTRVIYIIMFNGGPLTNISCKPRLEPDLWHWAHSEVPEYPAISGKVNMKSNQYIPSAVDFKKHCNFLMLIVSAEY